MQTFLVNVRVRLGGATSTARAVRTGEVVLWTVDGGIDRESPVDLDDLDLVVIGPLPPYIWYQDMADVAARVSDDVAGRRLTRAIQGKGAFRRFKNELHEEYPDLLPIWHTFRAERGARRQSNGSSTIHSSMTKPATAS